MVFVEKCKAVVVKGREKNRIPTLRCPFSFYTHCLGRLYCRQVVSLPFYTIITMAPQTEDPMNMTSVGAALGEVVASKEDTASKIVFTEEELTAMSAVKEILETKHNLDKIHLKFLAYTTIVSKNRVDEAVKKYIKFLETIAMFGLEHVESEEEMWADSNVAKQMRGSFAGTGRDNEGNQALWINSTSSIALEMEKSSVRSSTLYTLAVHADPISLREGIALVIDISRKKELDKVGNESKLQKLWQAFPLRPQAIYIAGASGTLRIFVGGLIKLASLFTKQKIIARIKFVTVDQVIGKMSKESAPVYLGGQGGGVEDVFTWTQARLAAFPVPQL